MRDRKKKQIKCIVCLILRNTTEKNKEGKGDRREQARGGVTALRWSEKTSFIRQHLSRKL